MVMVVIFIVLAGILFAAFLWGVCAGSSEGHNDDIEQAKCIEEWCKAHKKRKE